jgi:hypothetical protein
VGWVSGRAESRRRAGSDTRPPPRMAVRQRGRGGSKPQSFGMIGMVTGSDLRVRGYGTGGLAGVVSWVGMELLVGSG